MNVLSNDDLAEARRESCGAQRHVPARDARGGAVQRRDEPSLSSARRKRDRPLMSGANADQHRDPGLFNVYATVRPGVEPKQVEEVISSELAARRGAGLDGGGGRESAPANHRASCLQPRRHERSRLAVVRSRSGRRLAFLQTPTKPTSQGHGGGRAARRAHVLHGRQSHRRLFHPEASGRRRNGETPKPSGLNASRLPARLAVAS